MQIDKPNILLITADSLRADRLGCFGSRCSISPNINRFAGTSTIFEHAFSDGPNTPHAFPGIMASRCSMLSPKLGLFDVPITLAEALSEGGYTTLGYNAGNPYVSAHFEYHRGFDEFHDFMRLSSFSENRKGYESSENLITVPMHDLEDYLVTEANIRAKAALENSFVDTVVGRLQNIQTRPFFMWIHFMDAHYPYLPQADVQNALFGNIISREENFRLNTAVRENLAMPAAMLAKVTALYDAAIHQLDAKVGHLFGFLSRQKWYNNMLIVLCADHGEEFLEHGDLQHKSKMYDELLHVPLLVKMPGQSAARRHGNLVSLLQVAPTIMAVAGRENPFKHAALPAPLAAKPENPVFSAASIGGNGGTPVDHQMLMTDRLPKVYSIRNHHWKLIHKTKSRSWELFNLQQDPFETTNVYDAQANVVGPLQDLLRETVSEMERQRVQESAARNARTLFAANEVADGA